jgi:hypothetical protein
VGEIVLIDSPGIVRQYVTPVHHRVYEVALFLIDVLKDINIKPALQRTCGRHDALESQGCKVVSSFRGGREQRSPRSQMISQRLEGRKGNIVDKLPFFLATVPVGLALICLFEPVLVDFQSILDDTSGVAVATTRTPIVLSENACLGIAILGRTFEMQLLLLFGVLPFRCSVRDVTQINCHVIRAAEGHELSVYERFRIALLGVCDESDPVVHLAAVRAEGVSHDVIASEIRFARETAVDPHPLEVRLYECLYSRRWRGCSPETA